MKTYSFEINHDVANFNLCQTLVNAGWNGSAVNIKVVINKVVFSSSTKLASFDASGLPPECNLSILVHGSVYGAGGDGGSASLMGSLVNGSPVANGEKGKDGGDCFILSCPTSIHNDNMISAGSGGGAAGASNKDASGHGGGGGSGMLPGKGGRANPAFSVLGQTGYDGSSLAGGNQITTGKKAHHSGKGGSLGKSGGDTENIQPDSHYKALGGKAGRAIVGKEWLIELTGSPVHGAIV